jgi:DNA-binding SARP family transcriptional activator
MQFRMLGPLEVNNNGSQIPLGGLRQRATLAFLLLRPNQFVPTSELLDALWPEDSVPVTARKMLQNAVWGLRNILSSIGVQNRVKLATKAPGYLLEVDQSIIDLHVFRRTADEGRTQLAEGDPVAASRCLGEALTMWRGKPLSDLTERGINWPELRTIEQTRLNTLEDYFEAQIACGRHLEILPQLKDFVEAEPLRERPCGQLMRALYRSGRHADALSVYSQLRASLVTELGLEPSPLIQRLQQAVLTHDPTLLDAFAEEAVTTRTVARTTSTGHFPVTGGPATTSGGLDCDQLEPHVVPHTVDTSSAQASADRQPGRRQRLTIALVRAEVECRGDEPRPAEEDLALEAATALIRTAVEHFEASVVGRIGSRLLVMFPPDRCERDPALAIRTIFVIRECLMTSTPGTPIETVDRLSVSAAIVTGDAIVNDLRGSDNGPAVTGSIIDKCLRMESRIPPGQIWICDETHRVNKDTLSAERVGIDTIRIRQVTALRGVGSVGEPGTTTDFQMVMVRSMFELTQSQRRTHLVTVIGNRREVTEHFAGTLEASFGFRDNCRILRRSVVDPEDSAWLLDLAADRPAIAILEDLHLSDEWFLDRIEQLLDESPATPLLVVATAGTSLLQRRPQWAGGRPRTASITVDTDFDRAVAGLRSRLSLTLGGRVRAAATDRQDLAVSVLPLPFNRQRPVASQAG